jgi:hypothetical protein
MSIAPFDPPDLRIDPTQLDAAADGVRVAVRELSAAVAEVDSAWVAAAAGLAETQTGLALSSCRLAALAAVRSWADAVADVASELAEAAGVYRADDRAAMPAPRTPS